jgi:putative membrane protein insertion efficiency factor
VKNKLPIFAIKSYQQVSKMLPKSCRYYPTCSEYAIWLFEMDSWGRAFVKSGARILRCNQLFEGGIDYPQIRYRPPKVTEIVNHKLHLREVFAPLNKVHLNSKNFRVKYWIIPNIAKDGYFFIVKDLDGTTVKID